jgi:CheY-like chemotaxis protein
MIALMTWTQNSPTRILFVEDDEEVRSLIEEFLTDAGYEVDTGAALRLGARTGSSPAPIAAASGRG